MLKKDLAAALGISASMVSRLAKQGMPTDSAAAAQAWRAAHLDPARVVRARADTQGQHCGVWNLVASITVRYVASLAETTRYHFTPAGHAR